MRDKGNERIKYRISKSFGNLVDNGVAVVGVVGPALEAGKSAVAEGRVEVHGALRQLTVGVSRDGVVEGGSCRKSAVVVRRVACRHYRQ